MSKFLKIPNGNYKIEVQPGGSITLDTGLDQGQVIVKGDLIVEGNTTSVESEDLIVKDNIIVLNDGETSNGVTLDRAGIRIDRGAFEDAYLVFDETLTDPVNRVDSNLKPGLFRFELDSGVTKGIYISSISTGGQDLLISTGSGVISVSGTTNYELNVTDDDDITNKKYVDDAIDTAFDNKILPQIGEGTVTPSRVIVKDTEESTVSESQINFIVDNINVGNFYEDRIELNNLKVTNTTIEPVDIDENLILSSSGIGTVVIDNTLSILKSTGSLATILPPVDGVKIYTSDPSEGNTGIYFVDQDENTDEIISKSKALVFSIIF